MEKGFIYEIMNYEPITLGSTENRFLSIIARRESSTSAYDILIELRKLQEGGIGKQMAYKNVYNRVKRLEVLGLIKIEDKEFRHKAIKYKLTSRGLFQWLLLTSRSILLPSLLSRNKHNIIMENILYRFFEPETIEEFLTVPRELYLGRYLQNCCQVILSKVEQIRLTKFGEKDYESNIESLSHDLDVLLRSEVKSFVLSIVTNLKTKVVYITSFDYGEKKYRRIKYVFDDKKTEFFPKSVLSKDKKFIKLLKEIKTEFDDGYKQVMLPDL